MSAQRTSFGKLERDRAKKARAAAKRERRQGRTSEPGEAREGSGATRGGFDSAEVVIDGSPAPEAEAGEGGAREAVELRATNGEGRLCATAGARLPEAPSDAPDPREWPVVPLPEPDQRRHASREGLQGTGALGTLGATFRADVGADYLDAVGDDLALYRGPDAIAHPGWLLSLANYVLAANVALGPWIHTAS